ncbi:hypothetical protein Lesp02_17050 [Lentzea sp. NBRC 105346]|uniref:nitroreductase family protein n=1 Tax=Lentzea sp. NBRC 105346 TaxID=3032205 RepID=UPI0024A58463|nr:nitroreductase family protein [Lentzea sp. NBRC 105346]GLZ29515.1 hypothetical protein Lesp02_17050 [Lentzea sp. NBRC 105346]
MTATVVPSVWRLWERMKLSVSVPSSPALPVPPSLSPVLRLFEIGSAPSAGALYPYEHIVLVGDSLYSVDPGRRRCRLLHAGQSVRLALIRSGLGDADALVFVVVRPWLSMRKYGDRGYLYCLLDAAHVATHLLCVGSESFSSAALRTRARTRPFADLLDLRHSFVHSVLSLSGALGFACSSQWSCADDRDASNDMVSWLEEECWNSLAPFLAPGLGRTLPVHRAPLLPGLPPDFPSLSSLAASRRSTKDFSPGGCAVDSVVDALRIPLTTDLDPFAVVDASVVTGFSGDDLVRYCMGQEHLRHASSAVLFHADRTVLLDDLNGAVFRAGALAHLLYLGATAADVGVTAIGGFDADRWRSAAGLPVSHDVLYVALLGRPGGAAVKVDRLQRAHAHNER